MTVLLVIFFIIFFLGLDAWTHRVKKPKVVPDAFIHEWGISMADGGEKVEKK